ncbi:MAG: hypothetical protein QM662_02485 [Gordonia sp. (in: high G+C Gram-positive bacteria)]
MTTTSDVSTRLGRTLTTDEEVRAQGLLAEAAALVAGYLGSAYDSALDVVAVVESRVAARALTAPGAAGVASQQEAAGQVSHQQAFTAEASSSGGIWLSAADKMMLANLRPDMASVPMGTERGR